MPGGRRIRAFQDVDASRQNGILRGSLALSCTRGRRAIRYEQMSSVYEHTLVLVRHGQIYAHLKYILTTPSRSLFGTALLSDVWMLTMHR